MNKDSNCLHEEVEKMGGYYGRGSYGMPADEYYHEPYTRCKKCKQVVKEEVKKQEKKRDPMEDV